jgi:ATP-dependent protease ClpP protease subunit
MDYVRLPKNVILDAVVESKPKADEDKAKPLTVERAFNHVYFYAYVDSDRVLALIKMLRELDAELQSRRVTEGVDAITPIWLHISSGGGGLFDGLNLSEQMKTIKTPIYSIVEGYAASAATLISMACAKRFILPSSFMMIHQLSAFTWGNYEQLKDDMHLYDMCMARLVDFYEAHSKMPKEQIEATLKRDSWFDATQCLELGLVDELVAIK